MDDCVPSSGIPLDVRSSCFVRQHCNFFLTSIFFLLERITVQLAKTAVVTRPAGLAKENSHMIAWCDGVVYPHATFLIRWARRRADLATRLSSGALVLPLKSEEWRKAVLYRAVDFVVHGMLVLSASDREIVFSYSLIISVLLVKWSSLHSLTTLCDPKQMCSPGAPGWSCCVILGGADLIR